MLLIRGSIGPQVTTLQENLNTVGVTVDVDTVVIDTFSPPREDLLKIDREAQK